MNFSHVNTLCNYLDLVRDFILEEGERERERERVYVREEPVNLSTNSL